MYYHRQERDEAIGYLASKFPKCFFEDPTHRRPLKHDIILDLERENVLDHEKLVQVLDWYESHFVYRRGVIAGAERVDLNGKKAGTVTPTEQRDARAWIAARKREWAEQTALRTTADPSPAVPRPPLTREQTDGMNGHAMTNKTASPALHPSLAEMQTALAIVSDLMSNKKYEALRPVLATAALKEVVANAEKLICSLQDSPAKGEAP